MSNRSTPLQAWETGPVEPNPPFKPHPFIPKPHQTPPKQPHHKTPWPPKSTIMVLELRPNCEACDKDLPPASTEARICSYECTFCANCDETRLKNVCPNCGGGLAARPIRPAKEWRSGLSVEKQPPSDKRVHLKKTDEEVKEFSAKVSGVAPHER